MIPVQGEEVALVQGCATPIQMSTDMIQQVLSFLSRLVGTAIPTVCALQCLRVQHIIDVAPQIDEASEMGMFLRQVVGGVMTEDEHDLFCNL